MRILCQFTPYFLVLLQFAPFYMFNPSFYLLGDPASLLVVRIPIHSCPRFAINCSPLAASPTPRHPTHQVTYLHRQHQQHQLSLLIHILLNFRLYTGVLARDFFYLIFFCISSNSSTTWFIPFKWNVTKDFLFAFFMSPQSHLFQI